MHFSCRLICRIETILLSTSVLFLTKAVVKSLYVLLKTNTLNLALPYKQLKIIILWM